jgi:hypothetical protein
MVVATLLKWAMRNENRRLSDGTVARPHLQRMPSSRRVSHQGSFYSPISGVRGPLFVIFLDDVYS